MLQQSTVYAFHVPSINAIKVGFGADGRARMSNYSRQYALSAAASSLREWKLPAASIASAIESACHAALLEADFHRVTRVVDAREAQELFDLGGHTYEQAVLIVAQAIEETISSLYEALGRHKPLTEEKARQQKDEAKRRRNELREEKRRQKLEEEERGISCALPEIQRRWPSEVEPFVRTRNKARSIYIRFRRGPDLITFLTYGNLSRAARMMHWRDWKLVKAIIPDLFHSGRRAKAFYIEMRKKYGLYAEKAAERLGLSLWRPGGDGLPDVVYARNKSGTDGPAFLEVRLAVQSATGFGGDDAEELVRQEQDLMYLVNFAQANPPAELMASELF
jgi:hypothetical protein